MFRRAAGSIGTDHHLMSVKIRMHLKSRRKNANPKKINVNSTKIKDGNLVEAFQKDHCHIIDDAKNDTNSFHKRYELLLYR